MRFTEPTRGARPLIGPQGGYTHMDSAVVQPIIETFVAPRCGMLVVLTDVEPALDEVSTCLRTPYLAICSIPRYHSTNLPAPHCGQVLQRGLVVIPKEQYIGSEGFVTEKALRTTYFPYGRSSRSWLDTTGPYARLSERVHVFTRIAFILLGASLLGDLNSLQRTPEVLAYGKPSGA